MSTQAAYKALLAAKHAAADVYANSVAEKFKAQLLAASESITGQGRELEVINLIPYEYAVIGATHTYLTSAPADAVGAILQYKAEPGWESDYAYYSLEDDPIAGPTASFKVKDLDIVMLGKVPGHNGADNELTRFSTKTEGAVIFDLAVIWYRYKV